MPTNSIQSQALEVNSRRSMSFIAEDLKLTYLMATYKLLNSLSVRSPVWGIPENRSRTMAKYTRARAYSLGTKSPPTNDGF